MEEKSLWEQIKSKCLSHALALLEDEAAPTAATVEAVQGLVDTAIAIDRMRFTSPIGQWTFTPQEET